MEIVKRLREPPTLETWIADHLPPPYRSTTSDLRAGRAIRLRTWRSYVPFSDVIARVIGCEIELYQSSHYDALLLPCRRYEQEIQQPVTFIYWETRDPLDTLLREIARLDTPSRLP